MWKPRGLGRPGGQRCTGACLHTRPASANTTSSASRVARQGCGWSGYGCLRADLAHDVFDGLDRFRAEAGGGFVERVAARRVIHAWAICEALALATREPAGAVCCSGWARLTCSSIGSARLRRLAAATPNGRRANSILPRSESCIWLLEDHRHAKVRPRPRRQKSISLAWPDQLRTGCAAARSARAINPSRMVRCRHCRVRG